MSPKLAIEMGKIGGWYLKGVPAQPGEQLLWAKVANHTQSSSRAVGGKLFLTNRRLIFCPHWFDAILGGKQLVVDRPDIDTFSKQAKGGDSSGGGLRDRLRVELHDNDDDDELFVINDLDQVIEQLRKLAAGASGIERIEFGD